MYNNSNIPLARREGQSATDNGRVVKCGITVTDCRPRPHHCLPCAKGGGSAQPSRRDCLLRFAAQIRSLSQLSLTAPFTQGSQGRTPSVRQPYGFLRTFVTVQAQKLYPQNLKSNCPCGEQRATNGRPYILAGSAGNAVGASIARPHGRQFRLFEMPKRHGSVIAKPLAFPLRGRWVGAQRRAG